jgi:dTDP-4-amino-4,6-dideoxygalactose transaminase
MKLAINGGTPVRDTLFPNQANIGMEEKAAAQRVLDTQMLSGYRGNADKYKGGVEIQALEKAWSEKFGNKHSIAINSCTSALHVACMAIGLKKGDEVIVSPYSMTCSATAPLLCGATPVFADVEKDYFCLDYNSVFSKVTEKTKAIIVVDLFGQPFSRELEKFCDNNGIYLIEDAAQAVGSQRSGVYAGSFGHIGCFSFTQGKHLTAGEGGMITTNDENLARKCRLLLNHAEAVVNDLHVEETNLIESFGLESMWGFNMRMTEIQAAIIQEQLKKVDFFIGKRQENAEYLQYKGLNKFYFLKSAPIRTNCTHSYYCQVFLYNQEKAEGIHRDTFINAVKAELTPMRGREDEGVRIGNGYIKPLYRMPIFSSDNVWDSWNPEFPNVEKLWKDELFLHLYLAPPTSRMDLDSIIEAFGKVWENREELR